MANSLNRKLAGDASVAGRIRSEIEHYVLSIETYRRQEISPDLTLLAFSYRGLLAAGILDIVEECATVNR